MNATRNQQTGTTITVVSAAEAQLCDGAGTTKWYTICEDHNGLLGHATQRLARYFAASPIDWCEECRELLAERNAALLATGKGSAA